MLRKNDNLLKRRPQLSGFRHVCHCRANQACLADSTIKVYKSLFPAAFNREDISTATVPSAEVLSGLASLREVPDSDDGSTADGGAPARGTGWVGTGKPGYTRRDMCDGQTLASPGRWAVEHRKYPDDETLQACTVGMSLQLRQCPVAQAHSHTKSGSLWLQLESRSRGPRRHPTGISLRGPAVKRS